MAGTNFQQLARLFDRSIRLSGLPLFEQGKVRLTDVTDERILAVVTDATPHEVDIDDYQDPETVFAMCDCDFGEEHGACKHIWATLLAAEQFLAEIVGGQTLAMNGDHAASPSTQNGAVKPNLARVPQKPMPPKKPSWQQRLIAVLPAREQAPTPVAATQIEFYFEPPQWPNSDVALVVHVRSRRRKQNGETGTLRTTPLPLSELASLPVADTRLLALFDREANRSDYYWHNRKTMRLSNPWPISPVTLPTLLPLFAKASHIYTGPPPRKGERPDPLILDVEEPFRFELVRQGAAGKQPAHVQFDGRLRRGNEALTLQGLPSARAEYYGWLPGRMVRVDLAGAGKLAREIAEHGPLDVPAQEVPALLSVIARLPGARHVLGAELDRLPVGKPIGVVMAKLAKTPEAPITAQLSFDYDGALVDDADAVPLLLGGDVALRRDPAAEASLAEEVLAAGMQDRNGHYECERDRLPAIVTTLIAKGLRVLAEGNRLRAFTDGSGSVKTGIDWFEVEGSIEFGGYRATLPELLRRKLTPEGFVELGDGSFGLLPQSWVQRIEALRLLHGETAGDQVRLPSSQALLLDAMLSAQEADFTVDRKFAGLRKRLAAFTHVEPAPAPAGFQGELRPYQRMGLGWLAFLRDFGLGGCLADDMGLGKTVQVLAHLMGIAQREGPAQRRPSLLVAPRSVLPNWLSEAQRFAPDLRVLDFSHPDRWQAHGEELAQYDIILTTYALVRLDAVPWAERKMRFHHVILDESQAIKNADSQTSKAVRLLAADHRLALTGTPVENHLGELWSLFEFLNPGMLGRLPSFRALFGGDVGSEAMQGHRALVQRALRPVLLRRTKAQVLPDLPDKIEQVLWCDLEPAQRQRYDQLRDHYRRLLLDGGGALGNDQRFVALEALLRLRQAACHEALLDPSKVGAESAKLEVLMPRLEELSAEGHKVLVFSQFTSFLDLVEGPLVLRGIPFERLDGKTRDRKARIERFTKDKQCSVFLISLKAGGFGLNLTEADYVFLLDPWWNPAVERQAIDRTHRIGQKSTVHAYRLVCRGTVEERVLELQASKTALAEAILGNDRSLLQDLSREDLELLLG